MVPHQPETRSRELRIIPRGDRVCVVATVVPAMVAQTPETRSLRTAAGHWAQTSFLSEVAGEDLAEAPPRPVLEALGTADRAVDPRTRREALDRLARHLTEQA